MGRGAAARPPAASNANLADDDPRAGRRGRPQRARVVVRALRLEGYDVDAVTDGEQALEAVERRQPDLVVLDVMMPNVDGLTVCRRLRARRPRRPILMLTARHEVSDRVAGLDAGADDYLVKPFALDELLGPAARAAAARTSVTGERRGAAASTTSRSTRPRRRPGAATASSSSRRPSSTCSSCSLATRASCCHTRRSTSASGATTSRRRSKSLDVYIGYLRRKTEAGGEPRLIHTVRGVGYTLRPVRRPQ